MKNRNQRIGYFLVSGVIVILYFITLTFLLVNARSSFISDSKIVSEQIINLIDDNEYEKNVLQESLKDEYISRAKSLAFILDKNPDIIDDYDTLCETAEILNIDEIDIFSKEGIITSSTIPEYLGFSIHNPGQISFFLPMLEPDNYDLALCQDLLPNSYERKLTMYAMVWSINHEYLVEIGITPERLLSSMAEKDISNVLNNMALKDSSYFIYDINEDKIVSSTDDTLYGLSNADIVVNLKSFITKTDKFVFNDTKYLGYFKAYDKYVIGVCIDASSLYHTAQIDSLIVLIVLIVILLGAFFLLRLLIINEKKKENEYVKELEKLSSTLSSYKRAILSDALISLEVNLNKDILTNGVWKDDYGNEIPLKEILNLELPCSYDEYIAAWRSKFVLRDFSNAFGKGTDRQYLIDAFNNGSNDITFDYEAKTINGKKMWLRRDINMVKDANGDIISYTNVKDISEIISADKREQAYIRALTIDFESIIVVMFNEDKYQDEVVMDSRISDELHEVVGDDFEKEKFISPKLDILASNIIPEDVDKFHDLSRKEVILESLNNDKIHVIDFRLKDKDDNPIFYQARFIALKDEENIIGMIFSLRNIDDEIKKEVGIRQELEAAKIASEEASKAKTTFLFNMSHDIRTPMNAIIGFAEIAEKHLDDKDKVKDSLGKVKTASEHLLSLINDILDMSRIESGKTTVNFDPVCIDNSKNNLQSILTGSASERNIKLSIDLDPDIEHHWIYTDRLLLMRIFTNIVSNSIKYTNPGGSIKVLMKELPLEKEGYCHLRYIIKDTGIGMSKEFLDHIFEQFARAESATKSGVVGTGLGMSITKSLVELMGGTISIDSELGVGTTVTLDFEYQIAEEENYKEEVDNCIFSNLKGKKILLVEDNELNREIATEILQEEGMIVDYAEDGDIAVEKMKTATKDNYDLILMDIQMPRMNGYDATTAIRNLDNPYGKEIPIFAMTANAFDDDIKMCFAVGMNGHLTKPIDVPKLMQTLSNVFK